MPTRRENPRAVALRLALPVAAIAAVAWAAWLLFPGTVIVFNDDFGYLRSIVETIRRGRPWTDDWLEPWAASLSVLSAVIFKFTGSFRAATHGVQALALAGSFGAAWALWRARRLSWRTGGVLALLVVTAPALLFKSVEFGSLVLSIPCLLLAAWAAERRRWGWFFAAWFLAVATRQSALTWLAIPAWRALQSLRSRMGEPRRFALGPLLVVVAGVAIFGVLSLGLNETHARRVMAEATWRGLEFSRGARSLFAAVSCAGLATGVAGFFVSSCVAPGAARGVSRVPRWLRGGALVVLGAAAYLDPRHGLSFEHGMLTGPAATPYWGLLGGLATVGWWRGRFAVRADFAAAVVASAGLVALRPTVWDYYLVDVALWAAFAVEPTAAARLAAEGASAGGRAWRWLALAAIVVLGWFHGGFVRSVKQRLDAHTAEVVLHEQALRAGRITAADLGAAPFGFQGWHLFPQFQRHEGAGTAGIAEFTGYVVPGTLTLSMSAPTGDSPPLGQVRTAGSNADPVVVRGVFSWEWRGEREFRYDRSSASETARWPLPKNFTSDPFPLNDAEWRAWIDGRSK